MYVQKLLARLRIVRTATSEKQIRHQTCTKKDANVCKQRDKSSAVIHSNKIARSLNAKRIMGIAGTKDV